MPGWWLAFERTWIASSVRRTSQDSWIVSQRSGSGMWTIDLPGSPNTMAKRLGFSSSLLWTNCLVLAGVLAVGTCLVGLRR
jgi:hypothetical protein